MKDCLRQVFQTLKIKVQNCRFGHSSVIKMPVEVNSLKTSMVGFKCKATFQQTCSNWNWKCFLIVGSLKKFCEGGGSKLCATLLYMPFHSLRLTENVSSILRKHQIYTRY